MTRCEEDVVTAPRGAGAGGGAPDGGALGAGVAHPVLA